MAAQRVTARSGRLRVAAALVPLALAAACAEDGRPETSAGEAINARYDCRDNGRIAVDYTPDTATVTVAGRTHALPRAVSGSGARYTDGHTLIWDKGGTARLEIGDAAPDSCLVRK